jgi:rRNA processing protein Krr1/Pno1
MPTQSQTSEFTEDIGALQRAADFLKAFMLGFDVDVCMTS